ncbi:hypothetical protein SARC_06214 [Sphaeroforma arctica JP610]|uniref:Uncharacterized protein n=1 Tax=Sphaeroforma arctica JP610 TaxID=667725 RepID=A0A0L0FXT6_9EUKA|nr:hypothetical protein SARC_06214 [Sphaeroforma arctica JP610]KNC81459.1 hypothetical protein SARC_06214 [Sphaeroforma arctica JP610]|eukprot:XP_014155361.1 hypothetical protein SARC_06214 [Sphaeroforma arctica JP610]
MMAMSYDDELATYLIALDPDESYPSTIVHGAHAALSTEIVHWIGQCRKLQPLIKSDVAGNPCNLVRDHNGRKPYDRRIERSGLRYDMRGYIYMFKNTDKNIRSDSNCGYRTRDERYNRKNRYQYRYDNHDDHDRQDYRVDSYSRRDNDDGRYSRDTQRSQDSDRTYRSPGNRRQAHEGRQDKAMSAQISNDQLLANRQIAFSTINLTIDNKDVNDQSDRGSRGGFQSTTSIISSATCALMAGMSTK